MQNNILYRKVLIPANENGGDCAEAVTVTEETNCFIVWYTGQDGDKVLDVYGKLKRDAAIEAGVSFGKYQAENLRELIDVQCLTINEK